MIEAIRSMLVNGHLLEYTRYPLCKIVNRIYYVKFDENETVDHCGSLINDCDVGPPPKRLL